MSRALVILDSPMARQRAASWVMRAPHGTRCEFKASKRSLPQNDRMLDALKRELRAVPNLDGTGFVNIGRSSSDLTKQEMTDLIELIFEFGARHGVVFADDREASHAA